MKIKSVIWVFVILAIIGLSVFFVEPMKEAYALDFKSYTVTGGLNAIKFMSLSNTNFYVTLSSTTQVKITNADTRATFGAFNMTNALQTITGTWSVDNMDCNSALDVCVVAYTCGCTTAGVRERVVLFDPLNQIYSPLSKGFNYTSSSVALENAVISFGQTQYNIFATYADQGGIVHTKIDTLVFNTTDSVTSHPLVFGNTFDTGSVTLFNGAVALGSFNTANGNLNIEAEISAGANEIITEFNRGFNTIKCSIALNGGLAPVDITFVSDSVGQFFYVTDGHVINRVDSSCTITSIDLGAQNGNNNISSINVDSSKAYIFSTSQSKIWITNETSFAVTAITSYALPLANAVVHTGIASEANGNGGNVATAQTGTNSVYIIYWGQAGGGGAGGQGKVCVNTLPSATNQQLICWIICDSSGIPNTNCPMICPNGQPTCPYVTGTSFPNTFLGTQNVTTASNNLGCFVGLVSCINGNIQTNGTGYILLLLLILFSILFLFGAARATEHSVGEIPAYVWFAILFVDLGTALFLGWTNGLPFYGTLFGAIGMGALGIGSYLVGKTR